MRVDMADQEGLARFAEPHFGLEPGRIAEDMTLLGIYDDAGEIRGVFGVNQVYRHYCHMHVASAGAGLWLNRGVLRVVFGYVFEHLGLRRATAIVSKDNLPVQILALKLGFTFEGVLACGAEDGGDAVVLGLLSSNCQWIKDSRHG